MNLEREKAGGNPDRSVPGQENRTMGRVELQEAIRMEVGWDRGRRGFFSIPDDLGFRSAYRHENSNGQLAFPCCDLVF